METNPAAALIWLMTKLSAGVKIQLGQTLQTTTSKAKQSDPIFEASLHAQVGKNR